MANPYEMIGAEKVRALVDRFYDRMDADPEAAGIRAMHPGDLADIRQKLFEYLSGWLGGPNLYIEKYGHPRLRARHLPFRIGASERDQWMRCMQGAMADVGLPDNLREGLRQAFFDLADFMRNQPE